MRGAARREEARKALARWSEGWPPLLPMTADDVRDARLQERPETIAESLGPMRK